MYTVNQSNTALLGPASRSNAEAPADAAPAYEAPAETVAKVEETEDKLILGDPNDTNEPLIISGTEE